EGGGGAAPLSFRATAAPGEDVAVSWSFDRHELGAIAENGQFRAKGTLGGIGHVTAISAEAYGSTTVTIKLRVTQNGAMAGSEPVISSRRPRGARRRSRTRGIRCMSRSRSMTARSPTAPSPRIG